MDQEAVKLLATYRDELLPKKMKEHNGIYKRYNVEWIGREGLAPETHEEYLNDFINHFYKNVLKLVDRAMRKEDTSAQVKEIFFHKRGIFFNDIYNNIKHREKLSPRFFSTCTHATTL